MNEAPQGTTETGLDRKEVAQQNTGISIAPPQPMPTKGREADILESRPTLVITQDGVRVEILHIQKLILTEGAPSSMVPDEAACWVVMADIDSPTTDGNKKDGDGITLVQLRRNLYEHEAKEYAMRFTMAGLDFIFWENGREFVNPRYRDRFPEILQPYFENDRDN